MLLRMITQDGRLTGTGVEGICALRTPLPVDLVHIASSCVPTRMRHPVRRAPRRHIFYLFSLFLAVCVVHVLLLLQRGLRRISGVVHERGDIFAGHVLQDILVGGKLLLVLWKRALVLLLVHGETVGRREEAGGLAKVARSCNSLLLS